MAAVTASSMVSGIMSEPTSSLKRAEWLVILVISRLLQKAAHDASTCAFLDSISVRLMLS